MSPAPPISARPRRARWPLWTAIGVGVLALVALLIAASLYLARRTLGREVAIGWLRERGVEASLDVERLDIDGFTGNVRVGPAANPEVVIDRVEVRYRLQGFWNGRPLGVEVAEVRLVRPVARGSWKAGKFSLGSLDRVLDEFRRRPPQPDAGKPIVRIEGGRFVLTTDYGLADIRGDVRLDDGKLTTLAADLQPTGVRIGRFAATLDGARVTAVTRGDRVAITARVGARTLAVPETTAEGVRLNLTGELPYPDLAARRGDGRVTLALVATAERLASPAVAARSVAVDARFEGLAKGWVDSLAVAGSLASQARAASLTAADLTLANLVVDGEGPVGFDAQGGAHLRLAAAARAQGGWSGMGPPDPADDATIAAVKRLVGRFDLSAPGVSLSLDRGLVVGLTRPVRVAGPAGGLATISPQPGSPFLANGGGALRLSLRGGGLPVVDAVVPRFTLTGDGVRADLSGAVAGSLGPLQDAALKTAGRLTLAGGAIAYTAAACTPVTLARLELGANDVEGLAGSLCPNGPPLLTLDDGAWRVRARAQGLSAAAPFLEARVADAAGALDLGGEGEAFQADMTIATARVIDTAAVTRFNPVVLTGAVVSRGGDWTGDLAIADPAGHPLGKGRLTHVGESGVGRVAFDTGLLTFAEGGLQPADLSPLAAMVASPAVGQARFEGKIGWAGEASTSDGVLTLQDVGFKSPVGALSGLQGRIAFTSLAPLVTAPGQSVTVARVAAFVPLTEIRAGFALDASELRISGAELAVAGGRLRLAPLTLPLNATTFEGALDVAGVQLSDFVEASPFGDRVDVDAKVSGTLPFVVTPAGVRLIEGKLAADQPGRISIRREALSGVSAQGGQATTPEAPAVPAAPAATPSSTITDFAYQAMENLAFDNLDATLNSLPAGRLGVLFHIRGRHDPPTHQEIRLSWLDLITRRFLERSLPLPSGTPVNLTLDTSLNLDEVLRDVAAARSTSSPPVQP